MELPESKREALWLAAKFKNYIERLDKMIGSLHEIQAGLKESGADSDEEINTAIQSIAAVGGALLLIHPELIKQISDEPLEENAKC